MFFLKKLFGGRAAAPLQPVSIASYAQGYAAYVRNALPGTRVDVEHDETPGLTRVHWTFAEGGKVSTFLGNAYARYLQQPEAMDALFAEHLADARRTQGQDGTDDAPDPSRILPVMKTLAWRQASQAQLARSNAPESQQPVLSTLAGPLVLAYVEDTPEAMRYITPSRLERIGMDVAALNATAFENLTAWLPQLQIQGGGGRYAARLDHNYDASMVLVFGHWRERVPVEGNHVFAIAARDELLVCGSEDGESIAALREMAREIATTSAYGLSDELFVWREGRLQVLDKHA
ncbi:hypothetical protein VLK31_17840 [Variovorax sp. H27-G14]